MICNLWFLDLQPSDASSAGAPVLLDSLFVEILVSEELITRAGLTQSKASRFIFLILN